MSVMTVGPAVALDGPLPSQPEHCLLSIPGVVVPADSIEGELDSQIGTQPRWINGGTLWGYPRETPTLWDPCSTGTFRVKNDTSTVPTPTFSTFGIYQPITCSAMGMGDPEEFAQRAERVLDATSSFGIEEALSQGVPDSMNAFFTDTNQDVLAVGAQSPAVALAYLEEAIGATGRKGMIHLTPAVATRLGFGNLLRTDGPVLMTATGTPVAIGGGYQGAYQTGHSAPVFGQSWIFATGPVQVRMSKASLLRISDVLDRSNNDVVFRAERYVLATWDTALQASVLVDWNS